MDFEFTAPPGERPEPVCLVAHELLRAAARSGSGETNSGRRRRTRSTTDTLFVAYYASAELGCYRALGWPMPARILDLFAEFRDRTNGLRDARRRRPAGRLDLLRPRRHRRDREGGDARARSCAAGRGRTTSAERSSTIARATSTALARLLPAMLPRIDLPRALLRGRYMAAAAAMEHNGVPIDVDMLGLLREHWTEIQDELIAEIDARLWRLRRPHVQGANASSVPGSRPASRGRARERAGST